MSGRSRYLTGLALAFLAHSGNQVAAQTMPVTDRHTEWMQFDDAEADGWSSEVFSETASAYLKKLGTALSLAEQSSDFEEFQFSDAPIWVNGDIYVSSWQAESDHTSKYTGEKEIILKLKQFFSGGPDSPSRFKFKITSVETLPDGRARTQVLLETFSREADCLTEYHIVLELDWQNAPSPSPETMRFTQIEKLARPGLNKPLFSDVTRSALQHNPSYTGQVLKGLPHWLKRQIRRRATDVYGFPGIAVGDVNGDGLEDLFICESEGVPHSLYLQNPDGTLTNQAAEWQVNWLDDARSALLLDLDNDEDEDLAVAVIGFIVIASNEGTHFEIREALPCSEDVTHLSAADYDLDGKLDLYIAAYLPSPEESSARFNPGFFLDADQGAANSLYRQTGLWEFQDVTLKTGLGERNLGQTLSSSWEDFDQDGDPDLYVANDFGSNRLYQNNLRDDGTRHFVDIAGKLGASDKAFGMSAAWGDYNRDGWMDLYVANMWSSAGKRVISQPIFRDGIGENERESYLYLARGNTLLTNHRGEGFEDVSEEAGVTMGRWAWSSPFFDLDNDGWEDLVVANGYITGTGPGDL